MNFFTILNKYKEDSTLIELNININIFINIIKKSLKYLSISIKLTSKSNDRGN